MGVAEFFPPISGCGVLFERDGKFRRHFHFTGLGVRFDCDSYDVTSLNARRGGIRLAEAEIVFAAVHRDGRPIAVAIDRGLHRRTSATKLFFHVERNRDKMTATFRLQHGPELLRRHSIASLHSSDSILRRSLRLRAFIAAVPLRSACRRISIIWK